MVAETLHTHVDLAQPVEEQQAGLDGGMLELAADELQRRERRDLEQLAALGGLFQCPAAFGTRKRWRGRLGDQNGLDDGNEIVVPAPQRRRVGRAQAFERFGGARHVGPPFERTPVRKQQRDVELGLDVFGAEAFELEFAVPRHAVERAVKHRVGVVKEPGLARVLHGHQPAARDLAPVDRDHVEPGAAQIGLAHEPVMTRADDDPVMRHGDLPRPVYSRARHRLQFGT